MVEKDSVDIEKNKAIYKNTPFPYQSLDKDGRIIDVNTAWSRALGYKKEEVLGKWFGDFLQANCKSIFRRICCPLISFNEQ